MDTSSALLTEKLTYRRQFLLSNSFSDKFNNWQQSKLSESLYLQVHPDLELTQISQNGAQITLLGYIIDPYNPDFTNIDILNQLVSNQTCISDLFRSINHYGGRWIIFFFNRENSIVFNDTCGLRSIYYTTRNESDIFCASQSGLIASELNLSMDTEAVNGFINSDYVKNVPEYFWPGDSSPFKEIKLLLPNHYLDLKNGMINRFWPQKRVDNLSINDVVEKSAGLLKGLMYGASKRFNLAFTLTSGSDTRLLLAASKDIYQNFYFYTMIYYNLNNDSPDIKIPVKILNRLGIQDNIITCPDYMDTDFKNIYNKNVITAHNGWGNIAQALYNYYPSDRVAVKGSVGSNVVKDNYNYTRIYKNPTASDFAAEYGAAKNMFVIKNYEKWLKEANEISKDYNIKIFDFFNLEVKMPSWQGMSQLEWDIVQEVFTPFNCRELITTLISVDYWYRKSPEDKLHIKIIDYLWKELLDFPINPLPLKKQLKNFVKDIFIETKVYPFYRKLRSN